jgi:hypothetical protein
MCDWDRREFEMRSSVCKGKRERKEGKEKNELMKTSSNTEIEKEMKNEKDKKYQKATRCFYWKDSNEIKYINQM